MRTAHGRTKGNVAFGARSQLLLIVPCMGSRRTAYDPRWWMLVSAHEIRNIFCLRTAQVAWEPIKTDKTSLLLAHKSLDCVTLIFGFNGFKLVLLSFRRENFSTKIWKFCWGILLAQICPAHGARRTAHENVAFWIIAVRSLRGQ